MANIRVKAAVAKIASDIEKIAKHVRLYSGVSEAESPDVIRSLKAISQTCDEIAEEAMKNRRNRRG